MDLTFLVFFEKCFLHCENLNDFDAGSVFDISACYETFQVLKEP